MILIIGSEEEEHSKHIYDLLISKNENVCYLDTRTINNTFLASFYPVENSLTGNLILNGQKILLNEIKSVYWRWNYGIQIYPKSSSEEDTYKAWLIEREFSSFIDSLYLCMDCLWVNSLNAINMHKTKAYQTNIMAKNNIRVPKTLITNDKNELCEFLDSYKGELIYKPVRGGAATEKLNRDQIDQVKLDMLISSPVQFQELLEGIDVRVYVIGDQIFSAEIQASTLDFREDLNANIVPVELPENIKEDCFKIMKLLDLNFSGIDIRHNKKTDEYVFIEANPSPMFTNFEYHTGLPISSTLVSLLSGDL